MHRRNFIKTTGYCTATAMLAGQILPHIAMAATSDFDFLGKDFIKPINTKLRIKPICSGRVHMEAYEGPCRFAPLEQLTTEAERQQNMDNCKVFMEDLRNMNNPNAEILEPAIVEFPEGDQIDPAFFTSLEKEVCSMPGIKHV